MACLVHCNEITIFLQGIYIPYVWLLGFRLADFMISRLSAHLFGRFEPKKHVLQKAGATCAFGSAQNTTFSPKRNFLQKVAFWAKANNTLRTCKPYGAEEVHKTKSLMRVCNYLLALPSITKLPLIKVLNSHA